MKRCLARIAVVVSLLGPAACAKSASPQPSAPPLGTQAAFRGASPGDSGAAPAPRSAAQAPTADDDGVAEAAAQRRAGLGTAYAEQHHSRVRTVRFERAHTRPETLLTIRYDEVDAVREIALGHARFETTGAMARSHDGRFRLALVDEHGELLPGGAVAGQPFAVGRAGVRYRLGIENDSAERVEVVASVDGLNVMDGSEASLQQRGYVVDAFSSVVIEGWRTAEDSVAAFRFSEIEDSYADRRGRGRNVGVVGAAFFVEAPVLEPRHGEAFPTRFAPPPPPRHTRQSQRWW
jgi:hypothetical protein